MSVATTVLGAAGLGLGLGVVTGMPLGVVNVAIVDAASAGRRRFAHGLALGGAAADTVHAALAFVGVGRVIAAHRDWQRALAIAAAAIVVAYAIAAWRARSRAHVQPRRPPADDAATFARGIASGVALTLPNPGALGAWVTVAAAIWPDASVLAAIVVAAGVGVGSAAWFTLLARWIAGVRVDHPARRLIPRIALVALLALATIAVVRAL